MTSSLNKNKYTIITSRRLPALDNMLLDSYLAFYETSSYIRIYDWERGAISMGISNDLEHLNLAAIKNNQVDLIKRETGGGYLNHFDDLCFAFIEDGSAKPMHNYSGVRASMLSFLASLEIAECNHEEPSKEISRKEKNSIFCFNIINNHEISIREKKIIGMAQKLKKNRSLIHGSISYTPPAFDFTRLYRDLAIDQTAIGYLRDYINISKNDLINRLEEFFQKIFATEITTAISIINSDTYQAYKKQHKDKFQIPSLSL